VQIYKKSFSRENICCLMPPDPACQGKNELGGRAFGQQLRREAAFLEVPLFFVYLL
jgi:hypothetical protein